MTELAASSRPTLAAHIRLKFDASRDQYVLLSPEAVSVLNGTAAAILRLCDGTSSIGEIEDRLRYSYSDIADGDVGNFLAQLVAGKIIEFDHE